jgi:hypothetical protein
MTRGQRNNNCGNIRLSSQTFQGEIKSTDKAFKQFKSLAWGYRALIKILQTYESKYGCNTIRKIISRWAPANENDTRAYIRHVSVDSGFTPDAVIDLRKKDVAIKIARAISKQECAGYYDMNAIMEGFDLI